ncbi:hypothetical protein LXA43DRAFT_694223 [Ganoderma leucocontextum]|nr:hypothetical protein LXA43DRAFT_694223 [Ganoderma leucocontextum]
MDVFLPPKPERYYKPCPYQEYEMAANGNPDELYSEEDGDYDVETYREEDEEEDEDEDEEEEDEQPSGPWDMSDPQWGEGLRPRRVRQEPQPEVPRSWMNAAEDEMRIHQDRVSADRFYVVPAPGPRRTSSTPSLAASRNAQASTSTTSTSHPKPPDRLMLFRPPPPWSSLPSQPQPRPQTTKGRMPTSVFASSSTGHRPSPGPSNPPKRRQPENVAPVQARKRMRTITSMQNIFSMVQKRSESATPASAGKGTDPAAAASSSGPAGRANPFARKQETAKVPLSTMLKRLDPSARTPTRPLERARPSSERKPQQYPELGPPAKPQAAVSPPVDEEKANRKGASKRPAPPVSAPTAAAAARTTDSASPRPAKKLKPITTLPVPDWPGKQMKPLSEHKHKLQPPLPKAQKQTTLPATVAARAKPQRRVSAPTRLELTPAKPEKSSAGKPKSRGAEKQARKSCGGGKGFDWKGWSAS